MKELRLAAAALAVIVLCGAGLYWTGHRSSSEVRNILILVDGPSGAQVNMTIDADGESTTLEQVVPCEVSTVAKARFSIVVVRLDTPAGDLTVSVNIDGESRGIASSPRGAIGRYDFDGPRVTLGTTSGI